jgi:mevalonate pyrophosphate decarboxylase
MCDVEKVSSTLGNRFGGSIINCSEGQVTVEMPSNIALIKYMGKSDQNQNLATNGSYSLTLPYLKTRVRCTALFEGTEDVWSSLEGEGLLPLVLTQKGQERFLKFWKELKTFFGIEGFFLIQSANTFPSDCGIASSSSSFAALTFAAYLTKMMEPQRQGAQYKDTHNQRAHDQDAHNHGASNQGTCNQDSQGTQWLSSLSLSVTFRGVETPPLWGVSTEESQNQILLLLAQLSRRGSGSSCRSFFSKGAYWKQDCVEQKVLPLFQQCDHVVVLVEDSKKQVSSSQAHERVRKSLLFEGRAVRAEQRLESLLREDLTWAELFELCWAEFWDMHVLFETASPPFGYMTEKSLAVLNFVRTFWLELGRGPIVTMDAGANIHFIFHQDQKEEKKQILKWLEERGFLWQEGSL